MLIPFYIWEIMPEKLFSTNFLSRRLNHPSLTYVVRGAPVINDATMEDAEYVGMT